MPYARGRRLRACTSLLHAALLSQLFVTVLGNSKDPMTNFELQTNLVSCGTEAPPAAPSSIAVCSPPESKLFGNVKIVTGTPHPGSTGVRGRLYDVGKLCDAKVTDKIDRAWIAFLDCDGCALSTKLANLQSSNPQAILIYNQTSCVFPSPPPAPAGGPLPAMTSSGSAPPPAPASTLTPITTSQIPAPASTPPADNTSGGQHDGGDGDHSGHQADPEDGGTQEDPGEGEDGNRASLQLIRRVREAMAPQKRTAPLLLFRRDEAAARPAVDPSQSMIKYATTVAMAEQVTIDYLFQILLGPASFAPLPAALRSLKTVVRQHTDGAGAAASAAAATTNTITDLMVSISPSAAEPVAPEPKFVSMSKPIFAAVIGVLCAVVCCVVLVYVARPLILRHRRNRRPSDSDPSSSNNPNGDHNNNAHGIEGSVDSDSCHKNDPRDGEDEKAFHFNDFKRNNDNSSGFRSHGDLAYPQRPVSIPVHEDMTEKYRASLEDGNQAPAIYGQHPPESNSAGRGSGLGGDPDDPTDNDDEETLQAQHQLRQLRQQQQQQHEATLPDPFEHESYAPVSASLMRSRSGNIQQDEPQSGLPAWRQTNLAGSTASHPLPAPPLTSLRMSRSWAHSSSQENNNTNSSINDTCLSATSSRNGGDLFHSSPIKKQPPTLPPMIETNLSNHSSTKEGGLATALFRQRMMTHHDNSPINSPSAVKRSPLGDITSANSFIRAGSASRSSAQDLTGPTRDSLDQQHRRDIQLRFQEITGSSRTSASASASASARADGTVATPRASFSDDFATDSHRPSLELLRARHAAGS